MFCRIVDRVLLKIVGQLASSVEYTYYGFSRCHLYSMRLESHHGIRTQTSTVTEWCTIRLYEWHALVNICLEFTRQKWLFIRFYSFSLFTSWDTIFQYPTSVIQAGLLSYYIYINLISAVMPPQYQNYHKWDYAIPYRIGDLFVKS